MDAEIRICQQCGLRYPWYDGQPYRQRCPRCQGPTRRSASWTLTPERPCALPATPPPRRVALALDNLRSIWNVGALFRTADGLGVEHIWLGGITPTPENASIQKTALGAEQSVPWTYVPDLSRLVPRLRAEGWQIWALEQARGARPLGAAAPLPARIILIVGNEVSGVGPDLFPLCDHLIYLPMRGMKRSLNVEVAAAIALHHLLT